MGEKKGNLVVSEIHICYTETMEGVCCEIHTSDKEKCMEGVNNITQRIINWLTVTTCFYGGQIRPKQ